MNRQETDREARATKNVKNVWKWIVGVGIVLSLIAWFGGFFNHDQNLGQSDNPADRGAATADSVASDTGTSLRPDTVYEHVRGTN
ncbi:hypothetical protein [Dyadobacter fermentans]|uniref:Uncharacterized protein n=1 Tax=Dyadobacter fermentans (strain ATCC 700827 / DSM 18053 / CIP 107007 / KCTC 52180 / NS114) TaxID=471854 RepID=C6W789_DYAFD|nr:hypothetical protein [Dyadobacter fermentans]ACT94367.1 hypothetical protein Dfer_3154 [Dyadobacter fermentans DSM 18053]